MFPWTGLASVPSGRHCSSCPFQSPWNADKSCYKNLSNRARFGKWAVLQHKLSVCEEGWARSHAVNLGSYKSSNFVLPQSKGSCTGIHSWLDHSLQSWHCRKLSVLSAQPAVGDRRAGFFSTLQNNLLLAFWSADLCKWAGGRPPGHLQLWLCM